MINKIKNYTFELIALVSFFVVVTIFVLNILQIDTVYYIKSSLPFIEFTLTLISEITIAILVLYFLPQWVTLEIITIKEIKLKPIHITFKIYIYNKVQHIYKNINIFKLNQVIRC